MGDKGSQGKPGSKGERGEKGDRGTQMIFFTLSQFTQAIFRFKNSAVRHFHISTAWSS
jgi:hypothetical protein